ncbi:hypothetical protein LNJ03_11145 [Tenacibaculum dicentrarchi]|nr:hypothetical protein [Tenacibaculum dicentrarchi]
MIEINMQKIGDTRHEVFTLLNDCFNESGGWVQMDCRISDPKIEGDAFFINASDNKVAKNGDYSPLSMTKGELYDFISYLKKCHDSMSSN